MLRYACRSGDDGLDAELLSALGAAAPGLQEIDLSLHPHLDDAGLAALAQQCRKLKKVCGCRVPWTDHGAASVVSSLCGTVLLCCCLLL